MVVMLNMTWGMSTQTEVEDKEKRSKRGRSPCQHAVLNRVERDRVDDPIHAARRIPSSQDKPTTVHDKDSAHLPNGDRPLRRK